MCWPNNPIYAWLWRNSWHGLAIKALSQDILQEKGSNFSTTTKEIIYIQRRMQRENNDCHLCLKSSQTIKWKMWGVFSKCCHRNKRVRTKVGRYSSGERIA